MQSVTILGSTGSIGQNALDVISRHRDLFRVEALTAHKNIHTLYRQCEQFQPKFAAVLDETAAEALRSRLKEAHIKTEVVVGLEAICQLASHTDTHMVIAAIVGAAGLLPTLSAIQAGKKILLANKESLVMASSFFMDAVKQYRATLLPVDSEHNALFQCLPKDFLPGHSTLRGVKSIILTASGGPFRETPLNQLQDVTPTQAIAHPNWKMGPKISVDSATMMNKGLEVIEAFWLFGLSIEQIRVAIHPQSVIHSLVVFEDASLLAQLGVSDMRIPIANALAWPKRIVSGAKTLDITELKSLSFEPVCTKRFPALRLAFQALKTGGTATALLNAANEVAVNAFLCERIRFTQITEIVDQVMQAIPAEKISHLEMVLEADRRARLCADKALYEQIPIV